MLGLAAAPAPYAAANGGGHPSPAPFTAPAPTPSEPPAFGGAGYNAADWEVPADDPLPPTSGWASAASEPRRAAAPAPSAAGRPAAAAPQAQAPAQGNLPEWEVRRAPGRVRRWLAGGTSGGFLGSLLAPPAQRQQPAAVHTQPYLPASLPPPRWTSAAASSSATCGRG